jgi:hypothetical protein
MAGYPGDSQTDGDRLGIGFSCSWLVLDPNHRATGRSRLLRRSCTSAHPSGGCRSPSWAWIVIGMILGALVGYLVATGGLSLSTEQTFDGTGSLNTARIWFSRTAVPRDENRPPGLRIRRGSRSLSGGFWRRLDPFHQVLSNWSPRRPWSWHAPLWDEYGMRTPGPVRVRTQPSRLRPLRFHGSQSGREEGTERPAARPTGRTVTSLTRL